MPHGHELLARALGVLIPVCVHVGLILVPRHVGVCIYVGFWLPATQNFTFSSSDSPIKLKVGKDSATGVLKTSDSCRGVAA